MLDKLNKAYDDFVSTYGHFNKNTAIAFLRNDVDYANVFALEKFEETADEKGNRIQKFEKTDVFSKRVVEKDKEPPAMSRTVSLQVSSNSVVWTYHISPNNLAQASKM